MMYALVAPVLVFGGGAAIDYGRAAQIHTKLNAAADAAALAALTPAMLQQSTTVAQDAAVNMFNGLTENIPGLTANATQVTVSVTVGATALTRNVEVSYSSSVNTIFAQVLHVNALQVAGVSEASAQAPPNIDFYVLLDNSPSMALPATADGITQMEGLTTNETKAQGQAGGCAFACHQASTNNTDYAGNPCTDGTAPTLSSAPPSTTTGQLLLCNEARRADRQLRARPQEQHHAAPGRAEQRRFDPASDGVDDLAVEPVRHAAEISVFNLFDG